MNTRRRVIYAVFLAAIVANAFYLGVAFGRIYEAQKIAYEPPAGVNTVATVQALLNRQRTYAQFHQDLWVALGVGQPLTPDQLRKMAAAYVKGSRLP